MSITNPSQTSISGRDEAVLAGLDPDQRAVALDVSGPLAVIAGAGTGKTRAITHRIAHAVLSGQQAAHSIMAVTFTTRAAGELRARLRALGVPKVQARTFHSAALRQIRYFWPRATGRELPEIAGSTFGMVAEAARRHQVRADTAVIRDLNGEISWAKSTNVLPAEYPRLSARLNRQVSGVEPDQVAKIMGEYEQVKAERQVMDYDDILLCAVALMHEHPEVAQEFRAVYEHFVVDEYQDVSPLQHSLLMQWLGDRDELCVVGDPDQAIHSFAGADSRFLTSFAQDFPGAHVLHLNVNYRSTPQILAAANDLLHPPGRPAVGQGVVLRPVCADGPLITTLEAPDSQTEADKLADWLLAQHHNGTDWSQMAVLFRVGSQSPALEAALDAHRVPYAVRGSERFFERAEVRTALTRLRHLAAEAGTGSTDGEGTALAQVEGVLTALGWTSAAPQGQGRVRERWESWSALHDLAEQLSADGATTVAELMERIDERAAMQQAPVNEGVTLSTLHSAKGLEWSCVALVGVQDGLLPFSLAKTPAQIAEERRLFYVGITRARKALHVSWATTGPNGRGKRNASRFLGGLMGLPNHQDTKGTHAISRSRKKRMAGCLVCHRPLVEAVDIKLGHHIGCEVNYDEELLARLKQWRLAESKRHSVPAYVVFTDTTLMALAQYQPHDEDALLQVRGLGPAKFKRYGSQLLQLMDGADPDAVTADTD